MPFKPFYSKIVMLPRAQSVWKRQRFIGTIREHMCIPCRKGHLVAVDGLCRLLGNRVPLCSEKAQQVGAVARA